MIQRPVPGTRCHPVPGTRCHPPHYPGTHPPLPVPHYPLALSRQHVSTVRHVRQASFGLNPLDVVQLFIHGFWGFPWSNSQFWQNRYLRHWFLLSGVIDSSRFLTFLMIFEYFMNFVNISWILWIFGWSILVICDSFGIPGGQFGVISVLFQCFMTVLTVLRPVHRAGFLNIS